MEPESDLNVVERSGLRFLRCCNPCEEPHIHRWTRSELSEIRQIERWKIGLAALSGAVSGGILGSVEIGLRWWLIDDAETAGWWDQVPYWSIYLALGVLVSAAEILFLYWNVLRLVARICSLAGLRLSDEETEQVMAVGLTRAALDLPNRRAPVYGIDPYARVPRWKLAAYSILYRIKIGVTSFVLRVMLRRALARAALRFFIPLIAIPVFAVWNAVITWWVMREVRIRAAGPVAVQELAERICREQERLDEPSRRLLLEAVGEAMIRGEDAHPNFVLLLSRLFRELDVSPDSLTIDWDTTRESLKNADRTTQDLLLTTLTAAAILAGRPRTAQRELLHEAYAVCNRSFEAEALLGLYREFLRGQGLSEQHLEAVGSQPSAT